MQKNYVSNPKLELRRRKCNLQTTLTERITNTRRESVVDIAVHMHNF